MEEKWYILRQSIGFQLLFVVNINIRQSTSVNNYGPIRTSITVLCKSNANELRLISWLFEEISLRTKFPRTFEAPIVLVRRNYERYFVVDASELRTQEGKFARKFGAKFREKTRSAYYSKVLSKYCCNALQKYSKSVSSTQVTILSPLPVETSMNVWLLMWYEEPGVWVSVQTTTQSLQARGTWTGRHFLWLTYSYNNRWNSRLQKFFLGSLSEGA